MISRCCLLGALALSACLSAECRAQTLQDALVSAYRSHPQLEADRARQRATDEDVSRAWGGFRPQVVASGEKGRAHDISQLQPYAGGKLPPDTRSPDQEAVQVKQEIWDGNRTLADVRHSKWAVLNGRAILASTEQTVLGAAVQAYYDLYRDQKILEIQNEYVRSLEKERQAAQTRFGVKDVTRTDVAQAEARLARGIADQRQYEGNVATSKSAFLLAVGFPPGGNLPEPPPLPAAALPRNLDDALSLVEDNPDLLAAVYAEKAAEADIDLAESGMMPDLSLQATESRGYYQDYTLSVVNTAQVVLALTIPLYDGGVASARTRTAKHTYGQRRLTTDYQRDRATDAVKRSWESLQATLARISALEENARAALIALDGVKQELRVGSRTVLDELNSQQEYLDTQVALLRSRHDAAIAAYTLLLACGRLTAASLELPVDVYDPNEHYESASWMPWSPWTNTEYPEPSKPKEDIPDAIPLPDVPLPDVLK